MMIMMAVLINFKKETIINTSPFSSSLAFIEAQNKPIRLLDERGSLKPLTIPSRRNSCES